MIRTRLFKKKLMFTYSPVVRTKQSETYSFANLAELNALFSDVLMPKRLNDIQYDDSFWRHFLPFLFLIKSMLGFIMIYK